MISAARSGFRCYLICVVFLGLIADMSFAADDLEQSEQQAFHDAAERVIPAVVRIETIGGLERVGKILLGEGATTGLAIDSDGYIVTSAFNFLGDPSEVLVRMEDGGRIPATIVATDHQLALVLLKIETEKPLPVAENVPQEEVRVGQWAIAVGRAFDAKSPNLAVGIVSAKGRIWGKAIQTDAAVSPNNYGGPLVNLRGQVMGVLVPLSPQSDDTVAGFEWYDSGIGFAIPMERVLASSERLKGGEDLYGGVLGVSLQGRNPALGEPVVKALSKDGPAEQAGLQVGDRIVEVDGEPIQRAAQVKRAVARHYAGDTISVTVMRADKKIETKIELIRKPEKPEQTGELPEMIRQMMPHPGKEDRQK